MKRILYIATSDINKKTGGGIANLAILKSISKRYSDYIDVVHFEECLTDKESYNFITIPPLSKTNKIKAFLTGKIHRFHSWLDNFLDREAFKYSHCIINTGILGDCIEKFHKYGIKVAVIHHNYEVEFQQDNNRPSTLFGLTGHFVRKIEKRAYCEADMNIFLSEDDLKIFHDKYSNNFRNPEYVIGIFEPEDYSELRKEDRIGAINKLAICGSLNSVQTIKGIQHFKKNCLPILDNFYNHDYTLRICGRNPGKFINNLAIENKHIEIIPNPSDISAEIKDCGIFICPTNVGGGIKLRILDGLRMGMPILTHDVSARGYNKLYKYEWFQIYDDGESFFNGLNKIRNLLVERPNIRKEIFNVYNSLFSLSQGDRILSMAIDSFLNHKNEDDH